MTDLIAVAEQLPPEGVLVRTISDGKMVQNLKRLGNLWFVPDGSMYVYYTPAYWAYFEETP